MYILKKLIELEIELFCLPSPLKYGPVGKQYYLVQLIKI